MGKRTTTILSIFMCLALLFVFPVSASAMENTAAAPLPELFSEAAVLMDADTGQVLYQKEMDKRMYPASITKILTGLLALENGDPTGTITMSENAVFSVGRNTSHIALTTDEQITLEQALYALSIESANDAANGIAEYIAGSMDGFATMMNEKAASLGAVNSNFVNAHGLPNDNHYTTAYDMALITRAALQTPGFTDYFGAKGYTIPPTNKQPDQRLFSSRNFFLNGEIPYSGIVMSKTVWTGQANYTLVSAASQNGRNLIAVVLDSVEPDAQWRDTMALFDYGFGQFQSVELPDDFFEQMAFAQPREGGETATGYLPTEPVSVLLPLDKSVADISVNLNPGDTSESRQVVACLQLQGEDAATELTDVLLAEKTQPEEQETMLRSEVPIAPAPATANTPAEAKSPMKWYLFIVYPFVALFLLALARILYVKRRRAKRKRMAQRRLYRAQQRQSHSRYTAMHSYDRRTHTSQRRPSR